jgi:beta-keto acid cleavage enzyme
LKDAAVFGVKESLIADFKIVDNPELATERGMPNPFKEVTLDVVMSKMTKKIKIRKPCIICVAITVSLPTKENNPAVPITIVGQIESTQESFEAGASIVHCHVRDDEGKPTSDPDHFVRL